MDKFIINRNKQYNYLLDAINIFTETLSMEQILFAIDEVFETVFGKRPIIYKVVNEKFEEVECNEDSQNKIKSFELTEKLKEFAVFSSSIIDKTQLNNYFDESILKELNPDYAVPLLSSCKTVGMIFVNLDKEANKKEYVDKILDYLMRLIKIALEKHDKAMMHLSLENENTSSTFNLKSLNAMSHELFAELNLDILFDLAIDAFLEITASKQVSFVIYDEKSEEFKAKIKKCVTSCDTTAESIIFKKSVDSTPNKNKKTLDMHQKEDKEYFDSLFDCILGQGTIETYRYVILIYDKNEVLGFLLIAETVNEREFTEELSEVVDILATNTFLAIKNAKLFNEVREKKQIIENKLTKLLRLNNLINNINSAEDTKTMINLILDTLEISFNVEMGFFAFYDKDKEEFIVEDTINMSTLKNTTFTPNSKWEDTFKGDSIVSANAKGIFDYFEESYISEYSFDANGILIKPLCMANDSGKFLGVICIFEHKDVNLSDQEFNLYIDSIVNHTTPVMWNLFSIEKINTEG